MIIRVKNKKLKEAYDPSNFAISADSDTFLDEINKIYKSAKDAVGETASFNRANVGMNKSLVDDTALLKELGISSDDIQSKVHAKADDDAKKELQKFYANASNKGIVWGDWEDFLQTFQLAIAEDLGLEIPYNTYATPNKRNEKDEPILFTGVSHFKVKDRPTIVIYLDQSGSWANTIADELANELLMKLVELDTSDEAREWSATGGSGKTELDGADLHLKLKFFANHVHSSRGPAIAEGGTAAWAEILEDIKGEDASNVIIISDNDCGEYIYEATEGSRKNWPEFAKYRNSLVVDGNVWYIWGGSACRTDGDGKYGNKFTNNMIQHLHSIDPNGTYQYFLSEANIDVY